MDSVRFKMKTLTVLALVIIAGTSGFLIKVPIAPILEPTLAPSGWIHLQKLVLPLFENVCEESADPVISRLSTEFDSNLFAGDFWDPEVITKFQNLKSGKGFLPKGEIFSEYNEEHTDELEVIFHVMRNAKSFDTFYKVASWARQNLNCGLYVSLIYLALEHRRDTEKLTLPPPYELLPNYFIRKDIIIQGSSLLAGDEFTPSEGVRDEGNAFTLDANYTANIYENDEESKLAYFREDIGLNSYYFLNMLKRAPWLHENVDINSQYGEEMYHMIKQLVARYNIERYANGMPEQDNLDWDSLSDAPYDPMLVYSNGNEFIHRTSPVQLPENEDKALLKTIESNIATVVTHMRETGYNKTQILNHLMEILVTGERNYDTLARHLLGKALSNNGQPTVFEHYMTSLRDPMIWKLYKNIVDLVENALKVLPPYSKSELYFPGVELVGVEVKKMMTTYDNFEFDITEALKIGNGDTTFQVKIGQSRLNHKPFVMKMNITSLVTQKGLVKVYLGPKMIPGEFAKKKNSFYLLDCFEINIKKGSNIVSRTSNDMDMFASDFTSLKTLRKKVEDAQFGLDSLPLNTIDSQIEFPKRLSIPKGTPEGLPLQLFIIIAPLIKSTIGGGYLTSNIEFNSAVLSPLYPLDLALEDRILLDLPNALVKDISVTHKGVSKTSNYGNSGSSKSWYDNNGLQPKTKYEGDASFDYNSKKGQFQQDGVSFQASNEFLRNKDVQNDGSFNEVTQPYRKTSVYDYSSGPKQSFDYKSTQAQYQNPDYQFKRLYKSKSNEAPGLKNEDKRLTANEEQNASPLSEINKLKENYYEINESADLENNEMQSMNNSSIRVKHGLLKSSGSGSYSKQKYEFDNKSMRPELVKPDNKKIYKAARKNIDYPMDSEGNIFKTYDDNDENNYYTDDLVKGSEDNYKAYSDIFIPYSKYVDIIKGKGNVDILKGYKEKTIKVPNNKDNKVLIDDKENLKNFGLHKDDSSEQFIEIVSATKPPNKQQDGFSTYEGDNNSVFFRVIPVPKTLISNTNDNSIYKYIMRAIPTI